MCQERKMDGSNALSVDEMQNLLVAAWKQLPMSVIKTYANGLYGYCPVCDTNVMIDEKYCKNCGQKIFFQRSVKE